MITKKVLIISDVDSMDYWDTLTEAAIEKAGLVRIELDQDVATQRIQQEYGLIIMDISDLKILYHHITAVHEQQPASRIVVLTSVPTWKLTREVLRLGAADLIRKSPNPDVVLNALLNALQPL
jgi:DNA-binding NarL/FixJ family response regulator